MLLLLLKKLKLYTKLVQKEYIGPHKYSNQNLLVINCRLPAPTKVFYNWNITLNYCFIYKINIGVTLAENGYSRLARKGTFFWKKGTKNFTISPLPLFSLFFKCFASNQSSLQFPQKGAAFDSRTRYRSRICPAGYSKFASYSKF